MNPAFSACDSVSHEGLSNTWFTPKELIESLGEFDLDPCTEGFRPFDTAQHHICHDRGECGLKSAWRGRVWLNPPYGKHIAAWLKKMATHRNGVALVFARTETRWAQDALRDADAVNFLAGRIAFVKEHGQPVTNAGTGSMLLAWGDVNVHAISNQPGFFIEL